MSEEKDSEDRRTTHPEAESLRRTYTSLLAGSSQEKPQT